MKDRFKKFLDFDDPNKLMPWKDKSPEPQGEEPEDRPEIAIKPAWYFVMYFIMGVGFDTLFPTNVFPRKCASRSGRGWCFSAPSSIQPLWGASGKPTRTMRRMPPARVLITDGPYRFSRNPIYLAFMCLYMGLGIFLNNLWIFVLGAPLIATLQAVIIRREEDYLAGKIRCGIWRLLPERAPLVLGVVEKVPRKKCPRRIRRLGT